MPYPPVTADDILDVDDDDSDELKPPPLPPPDYILPEKKLPDSSKRLTPPPDASNHRSPFMYSDKDSSDDTNSKTSFGEYDENDKFDFGSHEINRSFEEPDGKLEGKLQTEKPNNQLLKKVEISDILPVPDWDNCSLEHIYDHICPPINDKDAQSNHRRWVAGAINAATRKKLQVGIMWNSMSKQLKDQNHNIHSVLSEARADTMKKGNFNAMRSLHCLRLLYYSLENFSRVIFPRLLIVMEIFYQCLQIQQMKLPGCSILH